MSITNYSIQHNRFGTELFCFCSSNSMLSKGIGDQCVLNLYFLENIVQQQQPSLDYLYYSNLCKCNSFIKLGVPKSSYCKLEISASNIALVMRKKMCICSNLELQKKAWVTKYLVILSSCAIKLQILGQKFFFVKNKQLICLTYDLLFLRWKPIVIASCYWHSRGCTGSCDKCSCLLGTPSTRPHIEIRVNNQSVPPHTFI